MRTFLIGTCFFLLASPASFAASHGGGPRQVAKPKFVTVAPPKASSYQFKTIAAQGFAVEVEGWLTGVPHKTQVARGEVLLPAALAKRWQIVNADITETPKSEDRMSNFVSYDFDDSGKATDVPFEITFLARAERLKSNRMHLKFLIRPMPGMPVPTVEEREAALKLLQSDAAALSVKLD